ncbi:MAG: amidase family protein [Rhodospirillaceae bacterium]
MKHGISKFALACALAGALFTATPSQARPVDFDQANILELQAAMAAGTLTAEKLTQMCLDRIAAYDRAGPKVHAVMAVNPKALEIARALDAERKAGKVRGPLHGIPVLMKDNYDTVDMPTTGGSVLLEGNMPPDDAYMVKKLRDAGAIIFAKVNLGEFANGGQSSLGGQSLNPHDLTRTPAGSSGGTGVAIAAGFAPLGLGTDTGGSIRGPSSVNGIVGLKPTHGLVSRDGIIPLALSLDTGGPMARSVSDIAVSLGIMTGVDPADDATKKSQGKFEKDYTKFLKADALKGARIGVARDFTGADPDVDWVFESALKAMEKAGATLVNVRYPKWFLDSSNQAVFTLYPAEFKVQIADYLKTTGPKYPKNLDQLIDAAENYRSMGADGAGPNLSRWTYFKNVEAKGDALTDPRYLALKNYYLPMTAALIEGIVAKDKLDAIVYPTQTRRPSQIAAPPGPPLGSTPSPTGIANLAGFPDLIVPAGFTTDDLPVTVSFFGTAFSEPKLLALGYAFEQATHALRRPVNTPALANATIEVQSRDAAAAK